MSARILIIEDKQANLDLMSYLLEAFGYTVRTAMDGAEGLESVRGEPPDLIVCDIHLPKMDGYEVARQLKAHPDLRSIPLIAVTALAMVGDREKVLAAGFDGYLAKPIVPETFVPDVEAFLQSSLRTVPRAEAAPSGGSSPLDAQGPLTEGEASGLPAEKLPRADILVVDDQVDNLELMRSILVPSGYAVRIAYSAGEAIDLARQRVPDLVLTDMRMKKSSGISLAHAFRDDPTLCRVRIAINSASPITDEERAEAEALGLSSYIVRPIEPAIVLEEVAALLQTPLWR